MAQVFTLDFTYKNFIHSAIVTVRSLGPSDHSVLAQLTGSELQHVLPEGELSFRLSNASRKPMAALRPGYNELEGALREAVTRHLRNASTSKVKS